MALGIVQAGYKNSLYLYTAGKHPEEEFSYDKLLAELTTELELALEGEGEDAVADSDDGSDCSEDSDSKEAYFSRKKEWEELLEQSIILETMLRQMMENGLGQQKEEKEKAKKKPEEEEPDNEFTLSGIALMMEGKNRNSRESIGVPGNSQFLQTNSGHGAEHWSLANGGRENYISSHIFCLTCETECTQKKQWKIAK